MNQPTHPRGVGKTTIAASLVHDAAVRGGFSRIVWATVGQDPTIFGVQRSIYEQLKGAPLPRPQMVPGAAVAIHQVKKARHVAVACHSPSSTSRTSRS